MQGLGFRGSGFRVWGLGFRVLRLWVWGFVAWFFGKLRAYIM